MNHGLSICMYLGRQDYNFIIVFILFAEQFNFDSEMEASIIGLLRHYSNKSLVLH